MEIRNIRAPEGSAYAELRAGPTYPNIRGMIFFAPTPDGAMVTAIVTGLPEYGMKNGQPVGPHGFHIHMGGICEVDGATPFESAMGHYNPTNQPHGNHAGDFPVLFSNHGRAEMTFFTNKFRVEDVIGKTVIIHENPDDYRTQPAGNSGARIACGVIATINN